MRKKVQKEVEVIICDFCGQEVTSQAYKCACCWREGHQDHFAYFIELHRCSDCKRFSGYICTKCDFMVSILDKFMNER